MVDNVGEPRRREVSAKGVAKRVLRNENAVLVIILVVLIAIFGVITKGLTVSRVNVTNVLIQSAARGVASIGQAFVILTGNIDLTVGGIALMTLVMGAGLVTGNPKATLLGAPVVLAVAIVLMFLSGAGIGALNGALVARVRMPSLIVTLGMWQITKGIAFQVTQGMTILQLPRSVAFFGKGVVAGVPVPIIIFVVVCGVAYFILNHTTFGRSVYATGGSPVSAWLSGIRVPTVQLTVFIVSGILGTLAGLIYLGRTMCGSMLSAGGLELDSIAAVCIGGVSLFGGRGSILGVIIGIIIISVINNGMVVFALDPALQNLVKGGVIIAAVAVDTLRRR